MIVNEYAEYVSLNESCIALFDRLKFEYLMEVEELNRELSFNKNTMLEEVLTEGTITPITESKISIRVIFDFIRKMIGSFIRFLKKFILTAISYLKGERGKVYRGDIDKVGSKRSWENIFVERHILDLALNYLINVYGEEEVYAVDKDTIAAPTAEYFKDDATRIGNDVKRLLNPYPMRALSMDIRDFFTSISSGEEKYKDAFKKYTRASNSYKSYTGRSNDELDFNIQDEIEMSLEDIITDMIMGSGLFPKDGNRVDNVRKEIMSNIDERNPNVKRMFELIFSAIKRETKDLVEKSHENTRFNMKGVRNDPAPDDPGEFFDYAYTQPDIDSNMHRAAFASEISFKGYERCARMLKNINANQSLIYSGTFGTLLDKEVNGSQGIVNTLKQIDKYMSPTFASTIENYIKKVENGQKIANEINEIMGFIKSELETALKDYSDILTGAGSVFSTYTNAFINLRNCFLYINVAEVK